MKKIFALACMFSFVILKIEAQKNPIKFGKVSIEELEMTECTFYPEATSMILGKTGRLSFNYNDNSKGWQYVLEIVVRKKILRKTSVDEGNIAISLYEPIKGSGKESLTGLKAFTFNLNDGKIEKFKLANSEKFMTRTSDYRVEMTFAMPNVQEGSILEYKYTITSDYTANLYTWYFQEKAPTAYSEFNFTIPEFYNYQISQEGTVININTIDENVNESFNYLYTSLPGAGGEVIQETRTIESDSKRKRMIARNILPVIEEPYMNNKVDVPSRVEFQLQTIQYRGQKPQYIAGSYEKFNREIMEWTTFGRTLDNNLFAKEFVDQLEGQDDLSKSRSIYYWLTNHFSWNEYYAMTSKNAGRSAYKDATGHAADINLTMVAALRAAGLDANPVILSTRGHGTVHPVWPNSQDFNYVIPSVKVDDKIFLMDATSRLPFGMLPIRCLNGKGWIASESGGSWVNLKNGEYKSSISSTTTITDEEIKTNYSVKLESYAASGTFNNYMSKGSETFINDLSESFTEGSIQEFIYPDTNNIRLVNMAFEHVQENFGADVIYINPLDYGMIKDNPFKREERYSSVDFPYAFKYIVLSKIIIPEGFTAETPKPFVVSLPEKGGSFLYSVSQIGNTITIMSTMELKQMDFSRNGYPYLKQFYQLISEKNNEMIVLKSSL